MRREPLNGVDAAVAVLNIGASTVTVALLFAGEPFMLEVWRRIGEWHHVRGASSVGHYLGLHKSITGAPWIELGRQFYDHGKRRHPFQHGRIDVRVVLGGTNRGKLAKAMQHIHEINVLFVGAWKHDLPTLFRYFRHDLLSPEPPTRPIALNAINIFDRPFRTQKGGVRALSSHPRS